MKQSQRGYPRRLVVLAAWLCPWVVAAQAPTAGSSLGAVTKIDNAANTLTLKTDAGPEVVVTLLPNVSLRRVKPGETNLNNAAGIVLNDISVGDRVLARGQKTDQGLSATLVIVMSQGDLVKKQAADRADWDRRGALGIVTAAGTDSITIRTRTLAGTGQISIAPAADATIRRYAPDSVRFADAKPGQLAEIKVGDQVRARGNKTPDGSKLMADEIVSGTFRTIAAVVVSVDPQEGQMRVTDLESKKPLTVKVSKDSTMHKLPPQLAQMIAVRVHPELAGRGGAAAGATPPAAAPDLQQLVDRSPVVTLADLKTGDAIVVSSTVGAAADRITVITLLCGVEPILTKPGTQMMSLGSWSLDMGGAGQ